MSGFEGMSFDDVKNLAEADNIRMNALAVGESAIVANGVFKVTYLGRGVATCELVADHSKEKRVIAVISR